MKEQQEFELNLLDSKKERKKVADQWKRLKTSEWPMRRGLKIKKEGSKKKEKKKRR